jgi:phosphoribosylformylglycinamidine synthase subunit PurS
MKFRAEIDVMPLDEILDPQGKVIGSNLGKLGINNVENVRIGRHIRMELNAENEDQAKEMVETACKKLLANLIMEKFEYHIEKA